MPRTFRAPLLLTVLCVPLGACSSLFGIHFADRQARPIPTVQAPTLATATPVAAKTMLGRQQLADGQVGAAIETFQAALADGEDRAPAINGLGVAYARLGRSDIALRFFEEATAIAPVDQRYASNLALLLNSQAASQGPALASSLPAQRAAPEPASVRGVLQRVSGSEFHILTADLQPAPLRSATVKVAASGQSTLGPPRAQPVRAHPLPAVQASPAAPRPTIIRVAASGSSLQRVSRVEVHVATLERTPAPAAPKAAGVNARFQPLVRIALADVPSRRPVGFIRIVLPEPKRVSAN